MVFLSGVSAPLASSAAGAGPQPARRPDRGPSPRSCPPRSSQPWFSSCTDRLAMIRNAPAGSRPAAGLRPTASRGVLGAAIRFA